MPALDPICNACTRQLTLAQGDAPHPFLRLIEHRQSRTIQRGVFTHDIYGCEDCGTLIKHSSTTGVTAPWWWLMAHDPKRVLGARFGPPKG